MRALRDASRFAQPSRTRGDGAGGRRPVEQAGRGRLGISEITVKAHRGQVMRKMRADSLADLVRMAGRLGLWRR